MAHKLPSHSNNVRDPISLLKHESKHWIPELVPLRLARMAESPFAFFRGTALIMNSDLVRTPVSGIKTQICGDAHIGNFGLFGTPERNLVFDITDFDETAPGYWEWDIRRLLASIELVGRQNDFRGREREETLLQTARAYREAVVSFAKQGTLEVWYSHLDVYQALERIKGQVGKKNRRRAKKAISKAMKRNSLQAYDKLTRVVSGKRRFTSDPPLLIPVREWPDHIQKRRIENNVADFLKSYARSLETSRQVLFEQFSLAEIAHKVVGVGSVGTRCWIALFYGRDPNDPLILQAKEARESSVERYIAPSGFENPAKRIVAGQRLMQAASDVFLGWTQGKIEGHTSKYYYLRQFRDWKWSLVLEDMDSEAVKAVACLSALTLARAHARAGDRVAIAAQLKKGDTFDRTETDFAATYADQVERDFEAFVAQQRNSNC